MKYLFAILLALQLLASANAQKTQYRSVRAAPDDISIFWLDSSKQRFGQIKTLADHLVSSGRNPKMLMNGGIFEPGGIPSGLLISDGRLQHALNQSDGAGNFFLKPNGVFYIDSTGAHVSTTEEYIRKAPDPRCAVQSGPMLLIDGQIHPAFRAMSTSRLHRNGVGILPDGQVLFAITEFDQDHRPNLYEFAQYFKDAGCTDALFLDGDISQMEVFPGEDLVPGNYFSSIIAIFATRVQQGAAANP